MKVITKRPNGTIRVTTLNDMPSKTDGSLKKECDVNYIIRKFKKTGQINHLNQKTPSYADVSEITDLQGAHQALKTAQEAFSRLPAQARKKFENNPLNLQAFLEDPRNHSEAIELGLLKSKPSKTPPTSGKNDDPNDDKNQTPPKITTSPT